MQKNRNLSVVGNEGQNAHSKVVVYSCSVFDNTNSNIPRVLSDRNSHPMEKGDIQEYSKHGLFAHDQSGALAVRLANVQLERPCSSLFPLVLLTQLEELRADHVHDVLALFPCVHCVTKMTISYELCDSFYPREKTYLIALSTQAWYRHHSLPPRHFSLRATSLQN